MVWLFCSQRDVVLGFNSEVKEARMRDRESYFGFYALSLSLLSVFLSLLSFIIGVFKETKKNKILLLHLLLLLLLLLPQVRMTQLLPPLSVRRQEQWYSNNNNSTHLTHMCG